MYRLSKYLHLPTNKIFCFSNRVETINTFFNINKRNFFKKTNYLCKKDYYSKNI